MNSVENKIDDPNETKEITVCREWVYLPQSYIRIYCDNCNKFGIIECTRGKVKCLKYWKKLK